LSKSIKSDDILSICIDHYNRILLTTVGFWARL